MNNIVIAGCSLSADDTCLDDSHRFNSIEKTYRCYPHYLKDYLGEKYKIHNIGRDAADNGTISRNLIVVIEELIEKGMHTEDIIAVIQWSGSDRHSKYVEDGGTHTPFFYNKECSGWSLSTYDDRDWQNYYMNEHTEEKAIQNTLDNISKTQQFLKSNNIKYKMFCGWSIFNNDLNIEEHIDISDFWFYNNPDGNYNNDASWNEQETNKYGGMKEWIRSNVEKEDWTRGTPDVIGQDQHPSNKAQQKFTNLVLKDMVKDLTIRDKTIVTTGCSFTNFRTTWSTYLEEHYKKSEIINIGYKGNSNDIILRGVITNVDRLLTEGKKIHMVLIQLTTMERKFMINRGNFEMSPPAQNFYKSSWSSWFMPMNEGFNNNINFWKNYWENIHSDELHFFDLLEKIFMVQSYLKSKNVKYKMFCGWDLFTDSKDKNIFSKTTRYENIDNELLKDKFGYCKTNTHNSEFGIENYWNMIDWDNWWFFENEKIKYGGITEWSQYNLDNDKWYQDDLHPSFEAHKKFNDDVILQIIRKG